MNIETTWTDGVAEMSEGSIGEGASKRRKVLKLHFKIGRFYPFIGHKGP
jgi:hypothetical protein